MSKQHEALIGKGLRIERHGRFISFDTRRSEAEHKEILTALASMRTSLEESIPKQASKLRKRLKAYNSFDIIANISFKNLFVDPERYKEYEHTELQTVVEYVTLLCLMDDFAEGENPLVQGPPDLEDIQNTVTEILQNTILYLAAKRADPDNPSPPTPLEEFQYRAFSRGLFIRNLGYPHHQTELLKSLFSLKHVKNWMVNTLGFEVEDIISFIDAIHRIINERMAERRKQAIESEKQLRREARLYRQGKLQGVEYPEHVLSELAKLPEKKMLNKIKYLLSSWVFFALGTTFSFTPQELASTAGKSTKMSEKFLDRFSINFGTVPEDFIWPTPTHPLRLKPIIHHDGRYLCPAPNLLFWAIKPAIEESLNPDSAEAVNLDNILWERYQDNRANYLVSEGLSLISQMLNDAQGYSNLKYQFDEGGQIKTYDLDGLILYDRFAFLVEGKAGSLRPPAQRGAPKSIVSDIKKLIVDSHEQASRAERYISLSKDPLFELPDGQLLKIDKSNLNTFFLISLTLDSLDTFTPVLFEVAELGIFGEGKLPWAVYLLDLRVIKELIEFPSQFVHYLKRRLRINELANIWASDELDWLGHYFLEGLYFEDVSKLGIDRFQLLSYTTAIDDYYMYETGERITAAPKPHQAMPELFKQIILELEHNHPLGYVDSVCILLDMDSKTRKRFARWFDRSRRKTIKDGRSHDFTFIFSEVKTGITVWTCRDFSPAEFEKRLVSYCQVKKYQSGCDRWVALGSHVRLPGLIQIWGFIDAPWEFDEHMEELVKKLFARKQ